VFSSTTASIFVSVSTFASVFQTQNALAISYFVQEEPVQKKQEEKIKDAAI
jgi:hypothetical protein